VIAENTLSHAFVDELHDFFHNSRTIRTAIDQVTEKYQVSPFWMVAVSVVAEPLKEKLQHLNLTMNIANNIQWTVGEFTDE